MPGSAHPERALSRREREILDILYARRTCTAAEVQERLSDPPGYSAVRKLLEILEGKGLVKHTVEGRRFVYTPAKSAEVARTSALRQLVRTFFAGSVEEAVSALTALKGAGSDDEALARIERASRARKRRDG